MQERIRRRRNELRTRAGATAESDQELDRFRSWVVVAGLLLLALVGIGTIALPDINFLWMCLPPLVPAFVAVVHLRKAGQIQSTQRRADGVEGRGSFAEHVFFDRPFLSAALVSVALIGFVVVAMSVGEDWWVPIACVAMLLLGFAVFAMQLLRR